VGKSASGHREITRTIEDHIEFVRLGQGVHRSRMFAPEAMDRSLACFKKYKEICDRRGVTAIHAVGTSASRDSANALEFYAKVEKETGITVHIIDGKTEARLSFLGGLLPGQQPHLIALNDIGGGSTEFVTMREGQKNVHGQSLDIGSVRATEMFLEGDPYTHESIRKMDTYLRGVWNQLDPDLRAELRQKQWVAIAGTPTTLAALALNLTRFEPEKVDGYRLEAATIQDQLRSLAIQRQEVRAANPVMGPGRADLMVAGATILLTAMDYFGKSEVMVSSRGLRHGLLLSPLN
jgi:exopolyphosphatase/guanosine-5'-triphosphate,3'-diphosphate pyrophosphatase